MKKKVIFICTHNSARSQMAEALMNALHGSQYEASSAGTKPSQVNAYAIKVMAEIGIDISKEHSKNIEEFCGVKFDYVVTVCDNAKETCPYFPGAKEYIHKSFDDPSGINGTEAEIIAAFRKCMEEIRDWLQETFKEKT